MLDHVGDGDDVNVYDDPVLYDVENAIVDELPVLLPLAQDTGGPILDLACGTGRTTLPMAEAGYEVFGVDLSVTMLARAWEKARERGLAVTFYHQDCRELDLPLTARMATMNGHAFQEFLTNDDQDGLFHSVHRHLEPGGVFVFDTRFPSRKNLDRGEGEQHWSTVTDTAGRTIDVSVIWSFDIISQVQDYTFIERISDATGEVEEKRSRGRLRYTWPCELKRLLDVHGFELVTIHGEWDGAPLGHDSREMIVVARKRDESGVMRNA